MGLGTQLAQMTRRRIGSAGALLPSVALGLGAVLFVATPPPTPLAPIPYEVPDSPAPAGPSAARLARVVDLAPIEITASADAAARAAKIEKVESLLARHGGGLGLDLRHQLAEAVVTESDAAHLDPVLVLAVMQVESEFDDEATSVRGAHGLMQIRPATLAFVAQREGVRLPVAEIAHDPVLSAQLAIRYLGRLNTAFRGNLDLALMAYNAGPHRVNSALIVGADLSPLGGYPRAVRRSWKRFLGQPMLDDGAVAERAASRESGL